MRERLVELLRAIDKDATITCPRYSSESTLEDCKGCQYDKEDGSCDYVEREADYLLENGVIVPPCKVGDVVYFVGRNNGKPMGAIDELVIVGIEKIKHGFNAKAKFKDNENVFKIMNFSIDNYGFFSTREEAKQALKGVARMLTVP